LLLATGGARIREILEVLDYVGQNARKGEDVRQTRITGTKEAAKLRGITIQSVRDSCVRQIGLMSVDEFDRLITGWRAGNPAGLKKQLIDNVSSHPHTIDEHMINRFFGNGRLVRSDEEQFETDLSGRKSKAIDERDVRNAYEKRFRDSDYSVPDSYCRQQVRKGQGMWRDAVLENFSFQCCVCGLSVPELLEAAHIYGWSDRKDLRLHPRNGLCLCVLHHRAFDSEILKIVAGIIRIAKDIVGEANEASENTLLRFDGKKIIQSKITPLFPDT
jgi:predicted restriction endonuclease